MILEDATIGYRHIATCQADDRGIQIIKGLTSSYHSGQFAAKPSRLASLVYD
jgi:hypothetical protein